MKTCYCCNKKALNIISLPYFNFDLCNFCTTTYYHSLKILNNFK